MSGSMSPLGSWCCLILPTAAPVRGKKRSSELQLNAEACQLSPATAAEATRLLKPLPLIWALAG